MNFLEMITSKDKLNYKCYNLLIDLVTNYEDFKNIIIDGIKTNMITGFSDDLWEKINSQNIRIINNFDDVFREGLNIGNCTKASKQLSYSFSSCYICGGTLPILVGTKNCKDGSHTWIEYEGKIIDTSLMLIIDKSFKNKIGYKEENRYNPNIDKNYLAAKDFTLDKNLKKK